MTDNADAHSEQIRTALVYDQNAIPIFNPLARLSTSYIFYRIALSQVSIRSRWKKQIQNLVFRETNQSWTRRNVLLDRYYRQYQAHRDPKNKQFSNVTEDRRTIALLLRQFVRASLASRFDEELWERCSSFLEEAPIIFPTLGECDARCTADPAIFINSQMMDMVQLFSRTLSVCSFLIFRDVNRHPLQYDPKQEREPYPVNWQSLTTDLLAESILDRLLEADTEQLTCRFVYDRLYFTEQFDDWTPGPWLLARCLMRATSLAIKGILVDRHDPRRYLALTWAFKTKRHGSPHLVDSDYLSTLILTFICLHEIGHFVLGHMTTAEEAERQEAAWARYVEEARRESGGLVVDVQGPNSMLVREIGADSFALDAVHEKYVRPAMLEAATLFCSVLETGNEDKRDWWSDDTNVTFAQRVWWLNGKFSDGPRQGRIAQQSTRIAESMTSWNRSETRYEVEKIAILLSLFLKIARQAIKN